MDLSHHGDAEIRVYGDIPGLNDMAVNVRQAALPSWLAKPIQESLSDLGSYPDPAPARAAVAARHGRPPEEVLLTAGAAQAFVLVAQALRATPTASPATGAGLRRVSCGFPVVVHPQFTEPEAALLAAGHRVHRVLLPPPFTLDPALIPDEADLVFVGNPTNPTSVLHPARVLRALARPGRVLVVDEAFADTIPGEPESLAARRDIPGLVVIRSFTKTWALAGLRIGYLLADAGLVRQLAAVQPLWPVSTPALAAAQACASDRAVALEHEIALSLAADRAHLVSGLNSLGLPASGNPASSFVLLQIPDGLTVRDRLRERGFLVRRGDTFPGLGPDWLRIAVRDRRTSDTFLSALALSSA